MGVSRWSKRAFSPPCKLGLRTKFSRKRDVSSSIPINWFISCNDSLFAGTTTHTAQRRTSERYFTRGYEQRRDGVKMAPGARSKFGIPVLEPEVFRKQMYCIEKSRSACHIVGTYWQLPQSFATPILIWRPGNCAPLAPLFTPLGTKANIGPPSLGPRRNLHSLFVS